MNPKEAEKTPDGGAEQPGPVRSKGTDRTKVRNAKGLKFFSYAGRMDQLIENGNR